MISGLFILIGVWVTFVLAAKLLPEKTPSPIETADLCEIRKRYRKFELLSGFGFFVITPIITYLLTQEMVAIQSIFLNASATGTQYVIGITKWAFMVPALFMSILLYGIVLDYIGYLVGKVIYKDEEEYGIFYSDWNKRLAFGNDINNKKLSLILTLFIVPLFLVMFFLGIDNYTIITNTEIIDNNYFSIHEKRYKYSDISKILYITRFKNKQSGEIERTSFYYSVIMKDGHDWDTLNLTINNSPKEKEILNFISQKSGLPIIDGIHNIDDKL